MDEAKKKYVKYNIIVIAICFIVCSFLTLGYGALITLQSVDGAVMLKSPDNIRVTNVVLSGGANGGGENYNPLFDIESISTSVSLPNLTSTVTYTVTMKDEAPKNYIITNIIAEAFSNTDMEYTISGLAIGDVIYTGTIDKTFTVTFKYKNTVTILPANINLNSIISLAWEETYMLTYDTQGGNACVPVTKRLTNNQTYGALCTTTRTDYTFSGWYTSPNGAGTLVIDTSTVNLSTDQALYAKWIYEQELLVGNLPTFTTGMIPVTYDSVNHVWRKANLQTAWYDYTANTGIWANIVTVSSTNRATLLASAAGTTIPIADINGMFVWIPRYSYAIKGTWGDGGTSATAPGLITIKFVNTSTDETGDAAFVTTTPTAADWLTHPAFFWDSNNNSVKDASEQKKGLWYAKFETSSATACTAGTTVNAACDLATIVPVIKPDVLAWRGIRPSTASTVITTHMNGANGLTNFGLPNDATEFEAYMSTNREWGAVAYLSQSIYGKYGESDYATIASKEVYINNSSTYYTGRSGGRPGYATGYTVANGCFSYNGYIRTNNTACNVTGNFSGTVGQYLTGTNLNLAYGASTTGNIYGAFDMSGGSDEMMMTDYYGATTPFNYAGRNLANSTGFNGTYGLGGTITTARAWPQLRFYDRYTTTTLTTSCGGAICYGHALSEVFSTTGWWSDTNGTALTTSYVIYLRGGTRSGAVAAGIFNETRSYGTQTTVIGFRAVVRPLK